MSVLEGFEDVRVISVFINNADSCDFLKEWNELQYIKAGGNGLMTEEEKQAMRKIRELLPYYYFLIYFTYLKIHIYFFFFFFFCDSSLHL